LIVVPFAAPPVPAWRSVMITRAFENGVRFAPTNKVGRDGDWTFGGASMIVDPFGQIAAECDDQKEGVIAARVGRQAVFAARRAPREADVPRPPAGPLSPALHRHRGHRGGRLTNA